MIIDFQHHFTPRELFKEQPADGANKTFFDANGVPSYSFHSLLYDLDEHVAMMDEAGIDASVLSCAEGMCGEFEASKLINDRIKAAETDYPDRFLGIAHAHPLGGPEAFNELARCAGDLGFRGVVITSEFDGVTLDSPALEPFWTEAARLGLYVFIHPALRLLHPEPFDAFDLARSVGREFSLIQAIIRLIDSGVLDRHPELTIQIAHLGGGIASMLGRIRSFQDRVFWGTQDSERHGCLPEKPFDHYIQNRLIFDTAGFSGDIRSINTALVELNPEHIVFATDYPQEIRERSKVRDFVDSMRALGDTGEAILGGHTDLLMP